MDRRKHIRLEQPQSSLSQRFRTLRNNSCRVRPLGHDPHHAKAACCRKRLVVNPNFPDGFLGIYLCLKQNGATDSVRSPPPSVDGLGVWVVRGLRRWPHSALTASPASPPAPNTR